MTKTTRTAVPQIRLSPEQHARLKAAASAEMRTLSAQLSILLNDALDRYEGKDKPVMREGANGH